MSLQCCARHKNCKMASPRCNEFIVPAKQNTCVPTPITFLTEIVSNGVHHIHNIANSLHLPRRLHIYKLQTHGKRKPIHRAEFPNSTTTQLLHPQYGNENPSPTLSGKKPSTWHQQAGSKALYLYKMLSFALMKVRCTRIRAHFFWWPFRMTLLKPYWLCFLKDLFEPEDLK